LPTAPQLTISTSSTTIAMQQPFRGTKALASLYGLALGVPGLLLVALGAAGRKMRNRLVLRVLGILTLLFIFALLPGCGGGINATIKTVGNSNNFTITVMGTVIDTSGNIEGVEVQTISLPVAPQP